MKYTQLGRSGVEVSRLCVGGLNFGATASETESHAILSTALDHGINFIDTANNYPGGMDLVGLGLSETFIGRWLSEDRTRRDKVVLATKVCNPMGNGPNSRGLSAYHIRRMCEESLKRLQTDHIDLYQMHKFDSRTPPEEYWQAMEQLVREGKITYVGCSNFSGWQMARSMEIAAGRNFLGFVSGQSLYNLADRMVELEVIPTYRHYGIGLLPWSALSEGILAGALKKTSGGRRGSDRILKTIDVLRPQLERYETLCDDIGHSPAVVATAWLLHNPAVTSSILGPRTVEHVTSLIDAVDVILHSETLQRLDEIWPPPSMLGARGITNRFTDHSRPRVQPARPTDYRTQLHTS